MKFLFNKKIFLASIVALFGLGLSSAFAQETVELNGDTLEYSMSGNIATAKGHVVVKYRGAVLMCDEAEMDRNTKIAKAKGHVHLHGGSSDIYGDNIIFNFDTMTGEFMNANIFADPYYGKAKKIIKAGPDKIIMEDGYMTTSDYDKPGYRLRSSKIEVYPGKKLVAHDMTTVIGQVPLMYVPRFAKRLDQRRPFITIVPGYKNAWGPTLLTRIRVPLNDYLQTTLHLDYRERRGMSEGFDSQYQIPGFGKGMLRGYYMDEYTLAQNHIWDPKIGHTTWRERYKLSWRHSWNINSKTNAIWQYYKISDANYLKDYFQKENDVDSAPKSYFVMTRSLPVGMMTLRADGHVNRWMDEVTRLPEVTYDLAEKKLGDTNFYFKDTTAYVNLAHEHAAPSSTKEKTIRLDTENEFSYLTKVGIFEVKPFVGGEWTYYSRTIDPENTDAIRGIFKTGTSISTKFYKLYDAHWDALGIKINQIRHVITPTITYDYEHRPTLLADRLNQFDGIDNRQAIHDINFGTEQKWQTKRNGKTVDLVRLLVSTDYRLKTDAIGEGLDGINWSSDVKPANWLTLYTDGRYNTREDNLSTANFDAYINGKDDKWRFGLGKRYNRAVDDLITTDFTYKVNRKWSVGLYERFDAKTGKMKEQEYRLTRDLHSWQVDTTLNYKSDGSSEVMFVFKLKAFPQIGFDFNSGLSRSQPGANPQ
ncbi:MAG: LPS assembly protein LptD [Candidatus Omnitrophica bacterium]|nr:LPS assembly protein LptD [Candidatus Omnitrophota bacterium]